MHWFTREWWSYLLAPKDADYSWWEVFWCRAGGHHAGVWWFTSDPEATDPDMHCKGCGDDLS